MSRCWEARGRAIVAANDPKPKVMGIVNVTPDSFSERGATFALEKAVERARTLAAQGADILDLGGESSRPGAEPITVDEEIRRVVPAVARIGEELDLPLSVDTTKAEVARKAIDAGASIVNDITALGGDPDMGRVVAETGAGVVLMHMQGVPLTMQQAPEYGDVVVEVYEFLARRVDWCESRGISRRRIAVDPGIGFGKTFEHNLALLRNLDRFANLGCVVLVGISRKGFLGTLTGRNVSERETASVVSSLACCTRGARVVRVHDVGPMVDAIRVWSALNGWEEGA